MHRTAGLKTALTINEVRDFYALKRLARQKYISYGAKLVKLSR